MNAAGASPRITTRTALGNGLSITSSHDGNVTALDTRPLGHGFILHVTDRIQVPGVSVSSHRVERVSQKTAIEV